MHVLLFFFLFVKSFKCALKVWRSKQTNSSVPPPPPPSDFSSSVPSTQLRCSLECLSVLGKYLIFNQKKKIEWMNSPFCAGSYRSRDRFFAIFGFELYISSYQDKMHLFISFHSFTMFKDKLVEINQSLVMLIIGFHFWKHVLASLDTCKSHKLE